jgi:broad specificity phosphatase PhoE
LGEGITERGWWNRAYEDWPECHERAARVTGTLRHWADGNEVRIAVVSHVDFVDALLKSLFKQLPADRSLYYYHYNAAISRIDFHSNGCLDIRYLNQVGHLPPTLISGNPRRPFACPTP